MAAPPKSGTNTTTAGSQMQQGPWPHFEPDEIQAVTRVLESGKVNYWTGQEGRQFEREFADFSGTEFAIALSNGTVALEACLKGIEIGPGDEVIVTPRSFLASVTSVITVGATPVFADVDPISGNLTAESIDAVCTSKTRAVMPVHLAGWPCEMAPIMQLAESKGIKVIEDCAQAHAAEIDGQKVGQIGHLNSWSFCQDKIMTTGGEGGMVTTDDKELWEKVWSLKDHGKSYDAVYNKQHPPGFRWLHETVGTNWRMTEMQSAIGRCQLRKLEDWVDQRRVNAQFLIDHLNEVPGLSIPVPRSGIQHAYYKFYCTFEPQALKSDWNQQRLITEISNLGVAAFSGSCSEIYLEKVIQDSGFAPSEPLPHSKTLGETSLMFLVHPTLPQSYLDQTVDVVKSVMAKAAR